MLYINQLFIIFESIILVKYLFNYFDLMEFFIFNQILYLFLLSLISLYLRMVLFVCYNGFNCLLLTHTL